MDAQDLLNEHSENLSIIERLGIEKQTVIEDILGPEILQKITLVEETFDQKIQQISERNTAIYDTVKGETLSMGKTISGNNHMMCFVPGKISWDTKRLEGYSAAHPEILSFRIEGAPYVQMRKRTENTTIVGKSKRNAWNSLKVRR